MFGSTEVEVFRPESLTDSKSSRPCRRLTSCIAWSDLSGTRLEELTRIVEAVRDDTSH